MAKTEYGVLYPGGAFEKIDDEASARQVAAYWNSVPKLYAGKHVPVSRTVSDWEPLDD